MFGILGGGSSDVHLPEAPSPQSEREFASFAANTKENLLSLEGSDGWEILDESVTDVTVHSFLPTGVY